MPETLACPGSMVRHVKKVLAGEYDFPDFHPNEPIIIDIGANIGSFSAWAQKRWPGACCYCYEPHPENFKYLDQNVPQGIFREVAVWNQDGKVMLWDGIANAGESTLFADMLLGATSCRDVECISAAHLPPCDVLKVDSEGCEVGILETYPFLSTVKAVALEWHSIRDRYHLGVLLCDAGFKNLTDKQWALDRGVMTWIKP